MPNSAHRGVIAPKLQQYANAYHLTSHYLRSASIGFWVLNSNTSLSESEFNSNTSTAPEIFRFIPELRLDIHCATIWALCSSVFENLQRLVVPLPNILLYLDSVTRVCSFADVSFFHTYVPGRSRSGVPLRGSDNIQQRQDLEMAVLFVQAHTKTFPGLLTKIQCSEDSFQDCMFACLPAPCNPTELVDAISDCFINNISETNLDNVTVINIRHYSSNWFSRMQE